MNTATEKLEELFGRDERESSPKPWLSGSSHSDVVHIDVATITEELARYVTIEPGGRAFIVGTDGFKVVQPGCQWAGELAKWLNGGCSINYLLIDPRTDSLRRLLELVEASSDWKGKLTVFVVKSCDMLSPEALNYRKLWETFHFAGFESAKGRQLWIEGVHERGQASAKECMYYPMSALPMPSIFEVYKSQFDYMLQGYADVVTLVRPKKKASLRGTPVAWNFSSRVPA